MFFYYLSRNVWFNFVLFNYFQLCSVINSFLICSVEIFKFESKDETQRECFIFTINSESSNRKLVFNEELE